MDSDSDRFINKLQRYKRRRGVYAAAQALRRQGLSLKAALLLLARAYESERKLDPVTVLRAAQAPLRRGWLFVLAYRVFANHFALKSAMTTPGSLDLDRLLRQLPGEMPGQARTQALAKF